MTYQDALFKGRTIQGGRGCDERWALIKPHLPERGLLLDIGSDLGYFGVRATVELPRLSTVSFEASEESALIQSRVLASHQLYKVCLVQGMINSVVTQSWLRNSSDWFDVVLLLSVIHWFDMPETVVRDIAAISSLLIVEVPDRDDAGACGQEKTQAMGDPIEWFSKTTGRACRQIGRCKRHTSDAMSHMILVEGPASRRPASVNLLNLMHLGKLSWPPVDVIVGMAGRKMEEGRPVADLLSGNLVWSADGLDIIDTGVDNGGVRTMRWHIGGTQDVHQNKIDERDKQASLSFLRACLEAWQRGDTAWANADSVRGLAPPVIRTLKRVARRILPQGLRSTIKRSLPGRI